jgi:hypothetical protein
MVYEECKCVWWDVDVVREAKEDKAIGPSTKASWLMLFLEFL